jgi:hypothetical protein
MSVGILVADGSTKWQLISKGDTHVSLNGTFGGGTVALEKKVNGVEYALYDSGAAITAAAADDMQLSIGEGVSIRLTLSGATNPSIIWSISAID